MYTVNELAVAEDLRANEPFFPRAEVLCQEAGGCGEAEAVIAIDGEPVALATIDLAEPETAIVQPTGRKPRLTTASWLSVEDDASVVIHRPGRHTLSVTVGNGRVERELRVAPAHAPVEPGNPIED